jgi:DNA/RNA endonuclease YhcR with UshA esterase domain
MSTLHTTRQLLCALAFALATAVLPTSLTAAESNSAPAAAPANAAAKAAPRATVIPWSSVKRANDAPIGTRIYLQAQIVSVAAPRPESRAPYSLYIADKTGTLRAIMFQDIFKKLPDSSFVKGGTYVDLYVKVSEYRGERQLEIEAPSHVRATPGVESMPLQVAKASGETFRTVLAGAVNITHIGKPIRVQGTVVSYTEPNTDRGPFRVVLRDSTGEIEGIFWPVVAEKIKPENMPVVGQPLELNGIAAEYLGKMQVRVDAPEYVSRTLGVNAQDLRKANERATAGVR